MGALNEGQRPLPLLMIVAVVLGDRPCARHQNRADREQQPTAELEETRHMDLILIILIILLLFGGGFGYRRYGYGGGIGIRGVLLILVILYLVLGHR